MADLISWTDAAGLQIPLFIGTDIVLDFRIWTTTEHLAIRDVSGYALSFMVKRALGHADAQALLTKTTSLGGGIGVGGAFNANPDVNTQVTTVTIEAADTDPLAPGLYYAELKRMDDGLETVLAYGPFPLKRGVHRA